MRRFGRDASRRFQAAATMWNNTESIEERPPPTLSVILSRAACVRAYMQSTCIGRGRIRMQSCERLLNGTSVSASSAGRGAKWELTPALCDLPPPACVCCASRSCRALMRVKAFIGSTRKCVAPPLRVSPHANSRTRAHTHTHARTHTHTRADMHPHTHTRLCTAAPLRVMSLSDSTV